MERIRQEYGENTAGIRREYGENMERIRRIQGQETIRREDDMKHKSLVFFQKKMIQIRIFCLLEHLASLNC